MSDQASSAILGGAAHALVAGELRAMFLPDQGMLCASLAHRGEELLRRVDDLGGAARRGSTAGLPLLHPWANRLAGFHYAAAGRDVSLHPASSLLHLDEQGLPMHGVPWSRLRWAAVETARDRIAGHLDWNRPDLLAVFPYPHRLDLVATLHSDGLTIETTLAAGDRGPVPVSFGFHPYLGLPGVRRADMHITLPAMRRLVLDERGIPTGEEQPFGGLDAPLGDVQIDDGFALSSECASFTMTGGGRRIAVDLLHGFPNAQVFAPRGKDLVALEPMTAPTNALASGRGLRLVSPGGSFAAGFRIRVEAAS